MSGTVPGMRLSLRGVCARSRRVGYGEWCYLLEEDVVLGGWLTEVVSGVRTKM
jgi:hypothetical protein